MKPAVALSLALAIASLAQLPAPPAAYALEARQYEAFDAAVREALLDMGMTPGDMRIRHDYAEPDRFRLDIVDSLMHNPASLLEQVDRLAGSAERAAATFGLFPVMWKAMDTETETSGAACESPRIKDIEGRLSRLPAGVRALLDAYTRNLACMSSLLADACAPAGGRVDFLESEAGALVTPRPGYEHLDPFQLHDVEEAEAALADSVLSASERLVLPRLAGMCALGMKSAENLAVGLRLEMMDVDGGSRRRGGSVTFGGMVIGGHGGNTYTGCFALIVDPGGDDRYTLFSHPDVDFRLIIDYAGGDVYESTDDTGVAGIVLGTSIILELAGDDTYRAGHMSLGSAAYGGALLYDAGGDDVYEAGAFSEGTGFLGVGAIVDVEGDDTYVAGMQSQGFGYVMGSGLILDESGNDTYYTKASRKDILRYEDHYLTLSQGCAFGSRPDYSGGIGLLIDSEGNDLYYSDIFGQGVGYWFCVGGLIDRGGHDYYCSYQYAQGSGVHLAFGVLIDEKGNDFYQSKGVSQGCGHDLSLGLLADFSGNDCYTATDLSQGAGNANGTGIIFDAGGVDSYSSKSTVNVNGYGNFRRNFGSIGLHVDLVGRDYYSARGSNDALWESGKYGLGVDVPGEVERPEGDILVDEMGLVERDYAPEELFILASRGEPRFRQWREYAFDRMVEDTASTVAYLRTVLDTTVPRERHTIKDILRKIGSPAVPMLSAAVREDDDRARREASWILGLIGDPGAFDPLMELSRAPGWKERSSAVGALARLDGLSAAQKAALEKRLGEVLEDPGEVFYVKKDAAFAAGRQGLAGLLPRLVEALESDHYSVRYASAEAMRDLSEEHAERVYEVLRGGITGLSGVAAAGALHAAGELPDGHKLAIVDEVLASGRAADAEVGVAVARLLATVEQGQDRSRREDGLRAALPEGSWEARSLLEDR